MDQSSTLNVLTVDYKDKKDHIGNVPYFSNRRYNMQPRIFSFGSTDKRSPDPWTFHELVGF